MNVNKKFLLIVLLPFFTVLIGTVLYMYRFILTTQVKNKNDDEHRLNTKSQLQSCLYDDNTVEDNKPTRDKKLLKVAGVLLPVPTAIISIFILIQANGLISLSNEIHRIEISPHFRIIENFENNDQVLRIRNYGGNFYSFTSTVRTYIPLTIGGYVYMIPLGGFYMAGVTYSTGDVVIRYFTPDNMLWAHNLFIDTNQFFQYRNILGSINLPVTYVRIRFQNVFGEFETLYLRASDSTKINNEKSKRLVDDFSVFYSANGETYQFNMSNITIDLLYTLATSDLRNSFRFMHLNDWVEYFFGF